MEETSITISQHIKLQLYATAGLVLELMDL
jgi:hypothetical protein